MILTLDLPDELLHQLQALAREKGVSVHACAEEVLREAVDAAPPRAAGRRFIQRVHNFGVHLESPWTVLAEIETEGYTGRYEK